MKRLLLSLCFALPVGCVLLVEDVDTFGETCTIQGSQTACGQCLVTNCQGPINFCCGDPNCDAARIDQCALGNCTAVNQASVWESCAFSACGSQCGITGADAGTDASVDSGADGGDAADAAQDSFTPPVVTNCVTSFNSCVCSVGGPSNTVVCDRSTIDNGHCCADATWPASGSCRCKKLSCEVSFNFGCECGIVDNGPLKSCQPTTDLPNCCAFNNGGCSCSKKLCESFVGVPVGECNNVTTACPNNGKSVPSCSF